MKIGILLYPFCSIWSAAGSYELFKRANIAQKYFHGNQNTGRSFKVEFVAENKNDIRTSMPFSIRINNTFASAKQYDLILVPGFESEPKTVIENSNKCVKWLAMQHQEGTTIASICTGSMLLAKANLIADRKATTHWVAKPFFEKNFPNTELDLSKVVIDYTDIMMSGSATSFQNLIIRIIEKYMGRTVAIGVSKIYLIDLNKDNPDSYMDLICENKHNDDNILLAQNFIKANYEKKLSLEELASKALLTKRTFIRRFRQATNDTPLNYIHKVKVEKAKYLLETAKNTFEEIAFLVGYEDVNAFRKIFTKQTGISPMKYRARYQLIS